jgi:hypothetical protein
VITGKVLSHIFSGYQNICLAASFSANFQSLIIDHHHHHHHHHHGNRGIRVHVKEFKEGLRPLTDCVSRVT